MDKLLATALALIIAIGGISAWIFIEMWTTPSVWVPLNNAQGRSVFPTACPMASGLYSGNATYVNDDNILNYVNHYLVYIQKYYPSAEIKLIEKYSNNYYVVIWDKRQNIGIEELLVYPNGVVHPEPQSMMWRFRDPGNEAVAERIAEEWLSHNFPGSVITEAYPFRGYYTFHFKTPDGDMQMISVSPYGQVIYHWWHGKYIKNIYDEN
ncbi:hypothetical protein [Thermoproteus tenax]|uniref:Uncharacterized protein n=1 Tax=Thermoproteus tenax (strain ATCC 35583 / DSM 2078 / JCM 9277 / NBRC 100435 / Kra 1) TaxID=768679 RepID=G4RNH0_THETK|nr:hypothetical protein [Thermoproteus tenax]CCC81114.1 hypothetical protein TTX_0447 [Thermoproteus tenax Kra 1]